MDMLTLGSAMDKMMAAFGKPAPSDRIVEAVLSKIEEAPVGFAAWAVNRITMEDKLPMNLAMAFRRLLPDYMYEINPRGEVNQTPGDPNCRICEGRGSLSVWKLDALPGTAPTFRVCCCNRHLDDFPANRFNTPITSRRQLKEEGLTTLDPCRRQWQERMRTDPEFAAGAKKRWNQFRQTMASIREAMDADDAADPRRQMPEIYR